MRDAAGRTPLLLATHGNHVAAAKLLIAAGADVNAKDDIQDSPYLYAGAHGRTEILKMTLAAGADLKSLNRYGGTALIPACHYGHVDAVKVLLATRIDIDHVNRLGWTALLEAVILGDGGPVHTEIVRLLLAAGANPAIADREGVTPLEHAKRRGFAAMARLLEARARSNVVAARPGGRGSAISHSHPVRTILPRARPLSSMAWARLRLAALIAP